MEDMQPTEGPLGSRDDENYPELTIDAEEGGSETGSTATASDEPPLAEGVSQQELPSKPSLDLDAIIGASKVSFDENGNLVVESASKGANSAGSESNDEDEDDGLDTPKVRQPLLSGADSPTGRLEKADVEFSSLSGDNTLRSHSRPSGRFNINDQFPLTVKNPSAADIIFLLLFAAATSTFFTSAVVASDVTGDPTCRDLDWDSAIQPYLTANDLDFKDCTEMVHVLSCEYMLKAEPGGETSASDESQQHRLAMHQVLNLCGGSCQVCGVTWLGKDDSGIGRWALFVCSALSPLLGLAWSRVYLSARNRADMLQFAQYLPGPLFVCLALLLVALQGGVVGHAASVLLLVNAFVSFSSTSSDRFQAACRAGELLEATVGTSLAQTLSLMFGGAISLFFLGWSSAFVAVLEQPVDSNSAAMLAALFFYAYWASYVWLGIYIITLSGVTASLVQQRPGATYQNSQKIPLVWAFFCRALRPRHLGVACRWGFVSGTGMLLWTCVTGLRSVFQAPWASPSELRTSQQSGCVRRISLAALPIIQFSHRAILLHVALDGSSIGDARDKTLHLLAKTQRLHGSSADNQLPLESGRLSNDERLQILDDDYYEYAPLIGPGISASFLATMVCGMCILFMVDAAGTTLLLLAGFSIAHATTTISLVGVSTVMDAVRMVYLMQPEDLRKTYPILHHRLMRLHHLKRQQRLQEHTESKAEAPRQEGDQGKESRV